MALVKFGAGVSEMRGKEGGVIYSRNAFGSYIKTKVSPVNPQTAKQQAERSLMGNLAQTWSTLSASDQAAWDNLGAQVTRINRFGDSTIYTGFALFMRLNRNLSVIGQAAITTAPAIPTIPVLTLGAVTGDVSSTTITIVATPATPGADYSAVLYATNNIVTGRKFVKNYYRLVGYVDTPNFGTQNWYSFWNDYYGNPLIAGAKLFIKVKLVDNATGFDGVPDVAMIDVVA